MSGPIGIAGLGLIGASLLRGLAERGRPVRGYDADPAVAGAARAEGHPTAESPQDLAAEAEVVFVAVPPSVAALAVSAILRASDEVVVADATSFKGAVVDEVTAAAPGAVDRFVPAHPLAGAEGSGWDASRTDLLAGAVWTLCPPVPAAPAGPLCRVAEALDAFDSRLLVCDPAAHDDAVARTSHVPHVMAQALAHLVGDGDVPLRAALSGGSFRDATRVARSDARLWADVLGANRDAVLPALDDLIDGLGHLRDAIDAGDGDGLAGHWQAGGELREWVERVRWGEQTWRGETAPWPAWDRLLELGREGRTVRRLRPSGPDAVEFEVADPRAPGGP